MAACLAVDGRVYCIQFFSNLFSAPPSSGTALPFGLATIFVRGALAIQVAHSGDACGDNILQYGNDEILVTAHVIAEGNLRDDGTGGLRQRLDAETEQISTEDPMRRFSYGERLRFPAKLFASCNFGNHGAFDYREYLAERGIIALALTKAENIEALPGFVGNRAELWRSRIHRSSRKVISFGRRCRIDGCDGYWGRSVHQSLNSR